MLRPKTEGGLKISELRTSCEHDREWRILWKFKTQGFGQMQALELQGWGKAGAGIEEQRKEMSEERNEQQTMFKG